MTPPPGIQGTIAKVSAAYHAAELRSTCVLTKTGGVACFGANDQGQSSSPRDLGKFGSQATSVATGGTYACASLRDGGRVLCWGSNFQGRLAQAEGQSGIAEVSAGFFTVYGELQI
jgi:alpha-tubulin suppressor-like RCC1 family protein